MAALPLAEEAAAQTPAPPPAAPRGPAPPPPDPMSVDAAVHLGLAFRLSSSPAFDVVDRARASVGAGAAFAPTRRFAFGLTYERAPLGREQSAADEAGAIVLSRALHSLWLPLRVYVAHGEAGGAYLRLAAGLTWQTADATGTVYTGPFASQPRTFACSASESANFALSGGLGGDVAIAGGLSFRTELTFDHHRLSSDVLDGCVPGAGTTAILALRAGLAYRFDVPR